MEQRQHPLKVFVKYNVTAGIATAVDFFVLIFLTEVFNVKYIISATAGALSGGLTSFVLERNWTFKRKNDKLPKQALKYAFVWITSIFLNVSGLYLLVEFGGLQYIVAKITVAVSVGIGFNFITHKYYIFK